MDPALTTIAQPMRAIGKGTVRLLLDILGSEGGRPASVTLPHTLDGTVRARRLPSRRRNSLRLVAAPGPRAHSREA